MKKHLFLTLGLLTAALLAVNTTGVAQAPQKAAGRTLKVILNYTGSGTVDDKHLIQVFLFDTPDFIKGEGMPFAIKAAAAKDGTVTFSDLDKVPVYVSVVFDPKGGYNEVAGPPPSGSTVSAYAKTPGTPEPVSIEPGETATIEVKFDDTYKMP